MENFKVLMIILYWTWMLVCGAELYYLPDRISSFRIVWAILLAYSTAMLIFSIQNKEKKTIKKKVY